MREKLLEDHKRLKNFDFSPESVQFLKEHFEEEENFFQKYVQRLGGKDKFSPLGMVLEEHRLLLKLLEENKRKQFLELLNYHLTKEETQIYTLLE